MEKMKNYKVDVTAYEHVTESFLVYAINKDKAKEMMAHLLEKSGGHILMQYKGNKFIVPVSDVKIKKVAEYKET